MRKMSTLRLNEAEKDLEKFIKFLALKSTQVVVQSRLGEKIQTQCNPLASGNDWFNIAVQDHPDVHAETKRVLALNPGDSIMQRLPLCIEISLKTVDGDQMVLEVWSLDLQTPGKDRGEDRVDGCPTKPNGISHSNAAANDPFMLKAAHAIYNRMGILLKSLISLTRATPAYKLSRRQCADSYKIYYRLYVDQPQLHNLGEGLKTVRIGQLHTVVGTLSMSLAYRTKMTITPTIQTRDARANGIMLKSDHFRPATDGTGTSTHPHATAVPTLRKGGAGTAAGEAKIIDIEKPLRPGAFTDVSKLRQYTEDDYWLPETPPFEWLLRRTRHESGGSSSAGGGSLESLNAIKVANSPPLMVSPLGNGHQYNINNNINNANNNNNANAQNNNNVNGFKNSENSEEYGQGQKTLTPSPTPLASLSQSPPKLKSLLIPAPPTKRHDSTPTLMTPAHPAEDDNLLKELNFPFASPNSHVNDLAKFYRDCYHAPPLHGLTDIQPEVSVASSCAAVTNAVSKSNPSSTECSAIDDLSRQLEQFETSLEDYDKLVSQFGLTGSSSTGSRSSGGLQMSN